MQGAGRLLIDGAGTVDLAEVNTFTDRGTIDAGTLVLGTAGAGGGTITFGAGDPPNPRFIIAKRASSPTIQST